MAAGSEARRTTGCRPDTACLFPSQPPPPAAPIAVPLVSIAVPAAAIPPLVSPAAAAVAVVAPPLVPAPLVPAVAPAGGGGIHTLPLALPLPPLPLLCGFARPVAHAAGVGRRLDALPAVVALLAPAALAAAAAAALAIAAAAAAPRGTLACLLGCWRLVLLTQ